MIVQAYAPTITGIRVGTAVIGFVTASGFCRYKSIVVTSTGTVTGILHNAFCAVISTEGTIAFITRITSPGAITGVRICTFGIGVATASGKFSYEAVVVTGTGTVTGILYHALSATVTTEGSRNFIAWVAGAGAITAIGVGALGN